MVAVANTSNSSKDDMVHYEEEKAIGEDSQIGAFDGNIKKLFMISGGDVIAYNSSNGNRTNIYKHENSVIGIFIQDNMILTYTKSHLALWQIGTEEQILSLPIVFPADDEYQLLWFYQYGKKHYILAQHKNGENTLNAVLFQIHFEKIDWNSFLTTRNKPTDDGIHPELICHIGNTPATKQNLVVGNRCCIKTEKKTIKIFHFKTGKKKNDAKSFRIQKEFVLNSKFNVDDQELVEFNQVCITGDSLYASLNIGRIYIWSQFEENGFDSTNCSNLTLTGYQPVMCVSQNGTIFVGAGNGLIYKYNLDATSGVGRWNRLEFIQMAAPPHSLALNEDSTTLIAILVDNSLCTIRTSEMKVLKKFELLNMAQIREITDMRFGIANDPLHDELIVANARFGHIQWIDPFDWKTVQLLDVANENLPSEDTFNRPNQLWLNTYLVCLSVATIVTCECRRDDKEKTYLKFWKRDDSGTNITLIDCFVLSHRVTFLRSTLGVHHEKEITKETEEILCVSNTGLIDVYTRDVKRKGHWCRDLVRHEPNWQRSNITYCSNIRGNVFSTIHVLLQTNILVWNLNKMTILQLLDSLKEANQIEWSPLPNVFIIACKSGLVSYDYTSNAFIWVILQLGLSITSNHYVTFAFNEYDVFIIDPETGTLEREALRFRRPQKNIIAVMRNNRPCFVGITSQGSLSMLRQKEHETVQSVIQKNTSAKETPFSQLFKNKKRKYDSVESMANPNEPKLSRRILLRHVSIKEYVDGPAYSLPPISKLAHQFVEACLTQRR